MLKGKATASTFHGLVAVNELVVLAGSSSSAAISALNSCGWSLGLRRVRIAFSDDHAAQPYTSSFAGSPPIQCESLSTDALARDHFAASASRSQSCADSSAGVMYISCN